MMMTIIIIIIIIIIIKMMMMMMMMMIIIIIIIIINYYCYYLITKLPLQSDVWALGCCVFEMVTLKHAFNGKDLNSLMYQIQRGRVR